MPPVMLPPHPITAVLRKAKCSHALEHIDRHHLTSTWANAPWTFCCGGRLLGWEMFASWLCWRLPSIPPSLSPERWRCLEAMAVAPGLSHAWWQKPGSGWCSSHLPGLPALLPSGKDEQRSCGVWGLQGKAPTACNERRIDSAAGKG